MFRRRELKGVLAFLACLFSLGVCVGGGLSELLEELKYTEKVICDDESKSFLISVLKNPELLKRDCFRKRAMLLHKRALIIMKLESLLFSGSIKDEKSKDKVERWLDHQVLLDDSNTRQEAELLIKHIEKQKANRIEAVTLWFPVIKDFIKDEQIKEKVQEWIDNPELLQREDVLKEAEALIAEIREEFPAPNKNVIKIIKNAGIPLYAFYRKFRFLKKLDNGTVAGDSAWYFDFVVSSILESLNSLHQDDVPVRSGLDIIQDDISRFVKEKALREGIPVNQVRPEVQLHGCQQRSLGFYYVFDSYLDHLVEKMLSEDCEGSLHKSEVVRFVRKIILFKFLPTYAYWLVREWFEEQGVPADPTPADLLRNQQIVEQRRRFSTYVPFKEAVKSSGKSLEYKLSALLTKHLNGALDKEGKGDLDHARDCTLGLVGPNLVSLGLKLAVSRAMIASTNKIKLKLGGQGNFLSEDDYFRPENRDLIQHARKESISYAIRNVAFYCLPKLFKKYRPKLFGWAWKRTKQILSFLEKWGWVPSGFSEGKFEIDKNVGIGLFQLCLELINCRFGMRMTSFDHKEVWGEVAKSGDMWRALDYYVAFWIGSSLGRRAAR